MTGDSRVERNGAGGAGRVWAIVLAGGDGVRLRPLVRRLFGDDRPKQFARLVGTRSMLGETLGRLRSGVPWDQTVVVTQRRHAHYVTEEFKDTAPPHILEQPHDRGTAAGVLFPAAWIARRDPEALVAIFPSDHFISDGRRFIEHVLRVADLVAHSPSRMVLLGAQPTHPEPEYGWIHPGARLNMIGHDSVFAIQEFWEKPEPALARRYFARNYLWNTLVFIAPVRLLLEIGTQHAAELTRRLQRIADFVGGPFERWAIEQGYAHAPRVNFSQAILQACPDRLAVSRLPPIGWSDWGTPERVIRSLRATGLTPSWLAGLAHFDGSAENADRTS